MQNHFAHHIIFSILALLGKNNTETIHYPPLPKQQQQQPNKKKIKKIKKPTTTNRKQLLIIFSIENISVSQFSL